MIVAMYYIIIYMDPHIATIIAYALCPASYCRGRDLGTRLALFIFITTIIISMPSAS